MDWFSKRGNGEDDDYRFDRDFDRDFDHDFYRDFDDDSDHGTHRYGRQERRRIGHSLWRGARELLGNGRREDALVIVTILVSWLIALSSHGEFTRMLSLPVAGAASTCGLWWLYHRVGAQWVSSGVGVSEEARESGLVSDTRERPMRTARRTIYSLTAVTLTISVLSTMATGSPQSETVSASDALPESVIELDSRVRATASGTDAAAVRKAWMLAGARNSTSALEVTGVLGQRVWIAVQTSTGTSTVCIETADASTPAKRTPCAGIGTVASRGLGPALQQQAGRTSGS